MKTQLFLIPLFLSVITIGQESTFTYLSQNQFNRSNLDYYSPSELDENGCRETVTDHTALWLEIGTFGPELTDVEKEIQLAKNFVFKNLFTNYRIFSRYFRQPSGHHLHRKERHGFSRLSS